MKHKAGHISYAFCKELTNKILTLSQFNSFMMSTARDGKDIITDIKATDVRKVKYSVSYYLGTIRI